MQFAAGWHLVGIWLASGLALRAMQVAAVWHLACIWPWPPCHAGDRRFASGLPLACIFSRSLALRVPVGCLCCQRNRLHFSSGRRPRAVRAPPARPLRPPAPAWNSYSRLRIFIKSRVDSIHDDTLHLRSLILSSGFSAKVELTVSMLTQKTSSQHSC